MTDTDKVIAKSLGAKDDLSTFIIDYSGWVAAEKISLPHFRAALHHGQSVDISDLDVKSLLKAVDKEYDNWMSTIDSPFNEPKDVGLIAFWDDDRAQLHALSVENDISDEWIKSFCDFEKVRSISNWFRHSNMLKKYRNCLIHESRQMGVKNRPERFDIPHYEHIGCVLPETNRGEFYFNLVYSCSFLYNLTKQAINNVEGKLLSEDINPFDVWPKQEIYWIDEFNKNTLLRRY